MIDPLNCVRYILSEDIDSFNLKLITRLSERFPGIFLIHRESDMNHIRVSTRLTLFHHQWGPTVLMELLQLDQAQTLILIPAPPDPGLEDVSSYETKILENILNSAASIRLARLDGNDVRALALIRTALREQRHHCWMQIQSELIRSLELKIYEGDPVELIRDIPMVIGISIKGSLFPHRVKAWYWTCGQKATRQSKSLCGQEEQKRRS